MAKLNLEEKLYSLQEIAKILRVSERSIFRYIHGGKLKATKIGYWRISKKDLLTFLSENANISQSLWLKENADFIKSKKTKK